MIPAHKARRAPPSTPKAGKTRAKPRLTPPLPDHESLPFHQTHTMGQQYNKHIKKKRRLAYLKRKKEAAKAPAKKAVKAKK
jgi:hypothetical protein